MFLLCGYATTLIEMHCAFKIIKEPGGDNVKKNLIGMDDERDVVLLDHIMVKSCDTELIIV